MITNNFNGIKDNATFKASGLTRGTHEGFPVKIYGNGTVAKAAAEEKFFGIVETIDRANDYCSVAQNGYKYVPYTGTAPSAGIECELVADGSGGVKTPATAGTGRKYLVASVDTSEKTLAIYLG